MPAQSVHHEIKIMLEDGNAVPKLPPGIVMKVGDTVHYFSPDGAARVEFTKNGLPLSPFVDANPSINDSQTGKFEKVGVFFCKCFVTPAGKDELGWRNPDRIGSGADHDIKPNP